MPKVTSGKRAVAMSLVRSVWASAAPADAQCSPSTAKTVAENSFLRIELWIVGSSCGRRTPIDRTGAGLAEQRVANAEDSDGLVRGGKAGVGPIAARRRVAERNPVQVVDANGERNIGMTYILGARALTRGNFADVVVPYRGVDGHAISKNKPQGEQRLRRHAVVIVALAFTQRPGLSDARPVDHPAAAVAGAYESCTLECHRPRYPPLSRGAEGRAGVRNAKDLRGDVTVDPIQAPDAAVVGAEFVRRADEQATAEDALERIGVGCDELEGEVVERPRVFVIRLAGKSIAHRETGASFAAIWRLIGGRSAQIGVDVDVRMIVSAE